MAALKEVAREYASEIRDGIGWVIVYRTGRSWHALTVWSDLGNNEWETDDINDALEALRLDPRAVALNGYYLGHFGDMTIDDIAAGIRWHYERGTNALVEVVADHYPNATEEAVERVAEAASSMKLSPEAVQRILDAFDNIIEAINRMIEWAVWAAKTIVNTIGRAFDDFLLCRAPPKWRHYALHAKRARVRKKYRNRIRRAFFAALASEGGGSS